MSDELIARAEAALDGVTPGPWAYWDVSENRSVYAGDGSAPVAYYVAPWNGRFMAVSRQLVPDLIAALRAEKEARAHADACNRGLVRLNEALQSRAERAEAMVAAAYREIAAGVRAKIGQHVHQQSLTAAALNDTANAILARTPADAQAAMDRIQQQAANEALERAAARYALPGYCEEGGE